MKLILAFSIVAGFALSASRAEANITYDLVNYPTDQGGATLSGFITTDGTVGDLAAGDVTILAWSWTITPPGGQPFTLNSSDPNIYSSAVGSVIVTSDEITIGAPASGNNSFALADSGGDQLNYDRFSSFSLYYGSVAWNTYDPAMGGNEPWVIATASAVPEPSSLAMLGTAAVFGLAGWNRRRRQAIAA